MCKILKNKFMVFPTFSLLMMLGSHPSLGQNISTPSFDRLEQMNTGSESSAYFPTLYFHQPLHQTTTNAIDQINQQFQYNISGYSDKKQSYFKLTKKNIGANIQQIDVEQTLSPEERKAYPQAPPQKVLICLLFTNNQIVQGYSITEPVAASDYPSTAISNIKTNYALDPISLQDIRLQFPNIRLEVFSNRTEGYITQYVFAKSLAADVLISESYFPESSLPLFQTFISSSIQHILLFWI